MCMHGCIRWAWHSRLSLVLVGPLTELQDFQSFLPLCNLSPSSDLFELQQPKNPNSRVTVRFHRDNLDYYSQPSHPLILARILFRPVGPGTLNTDTNSAIEAVIAPRFRRRPVSIRPVTSANRLRGGNNSTDKYGGTAVNLGVVAIQERLWCSRFRSRQRQAFSADTCTVWRANKTLGRTKGGTQKASKAQAKKGPTPVHKTASTELRLGFFPLVKGRTLYPGASSSCVGDWNVRMTSLPLVVAVLVFFFLFGIASSLSLPVPVSSGVPSHLARPGPDRRRPDEPIDSGLIWITTPSGWR